MTWSAKLLAEIPNMFDNWVVMALRMVPSPSDVKVSTVTVTDPFSIMLPLLFLPAASTKFN